MEIRAGSPLRTELPAQREIDRLSTAGSAYFPWQSLLDVPARSWAEG